jgi:hypothetical protein
VDNHAYPINDGLCVYANANAQVLVVGTIDPDCRCAARFASSMLSVWQVIEVDRKQVRIRYLGGSRFEVIDEGSAWTLDSNRDNGDYCEPGKPTS